MLRYFLVGINYAVWEIIYLKYVRDSIFSKATVLRASSIFPPPIPFFNASTWTLLQTLIFEVRFLAWSTWIFFLTTLERGRGQNTGFGWTHNPKSPFSGVGKVACRIALTYIHTSGASAGGTFLRKQNKSSSSPRYVQPQWVFLQSTYSEISSPLYPCMYDTFGGAMGMVRKVKTYTIFLSGTRQVSFGLGLL